MKLVYEARITPEALIPLPRPVVQLLGCSLPLLYSGEPALTVQVEIGSCRLHGCQLADALLLGSFSVYPCPAGFPFAVSGKRRTSVPFPIILPVPISTRAKRTPTAVSVTVRVVVMVP